MLRLLGIGVLLLALPVVLVLTIGVLAINGAAIAASAIQPTLPASDEALADIPPALLGLYQQAAARCGGLPWQVVAGIGKVESNHGRYGGAAVDPDGRISPPIIGVPLDGSRGTARIPDTDNGQWDGDTVWDRAVGPFQFIPSSWAIFGVDGNDDGTADPNNFYDAVPAAVAHLCPGGRVTGLDAAIFSYNRSQAYVDLVLVWAERYTSPELVVTTGEYAYPLPLVYATEAIAGRAHHDYPAIDVGVPVGTPTYAVVAGQVLTAHGSAGRFPADPNRCGNTVTVAGIDGAIYTYCHLSSVTVVVGQTVLPGTTVGLTGGQPGAPGAGNTTGPHLHLSIQINGTSVCPQPLLIGIVNGSPVAPSSLPRSGCTR